MAGTERTETAEEIGRRWVSGHLYYHQDLDRAVRGFVHPLAATLAREGRIDGFFFIRHGLGGPHVRVRLRPAAGAGAQVREAMRRRAKVFLAREPSTLSRDAEAIRHINALILEADRHENDDSVYRDNSFRAVPFRPEIERYGGPERLAISLDCFTLSSVAAVDLVLRCAGAARPLQLARAFRLLLRQALAFAADEQELADLLRYGVDWLGREFEKAVARGDRVAEAQMDDLLGAFGDGLSAVRTLRSPAPPCTGPADFLVAGVHRLSAALGTAGRRARARIGGSHLHMTASRIGIGNPEEVYLSRLLTLTLRRAHEAGTSLSWLRETAADPAVEDPAEAVGRLLQPALATLAGLGAP